MERSGTNAILAKRIERGKVVLNRNLAVVLEEGTEDVARRVMEKSRYFVADVRGCDLYLFDPYIFDTICQTPRTAMRDGYGSTGFK